jgi:phenylalanyl-tRNA synthetase alpha subunit
MRKVILLFLDSGIPQIENAVISTIAENAGLALLRDVLGQMTIAANEVENLLKVSIQGWSIAVEQLEQKLAEYAAGADRAKKRLEDIQKKIITQQQELTEKFNQEVDQFGEQASEGIGQEIDALVNRLKTNIRSQYQSPLQSLFQFLKDTMSGFSRDSGYTIEFSSREKAEEVYEYINNCCTPIIQEFWLKTQDKLSREGDFRRYEVAREIEQEVQVLADELADLLGEVLEFEFKPAKIMVPNYDFPGIDKQVEKQRRIERYERDETRTQQRCCDSPNSYSIKVPDEREVTYFAIDFQDVKKRFTSAIRIQKRIIKELLEKVISDQIHTDLSTAKNQFTESFHRIEQELQHIIQQHAAHVTDDQIVERKKQLAILQEYQQEITRIQSELELT